MKIRANKNRRRGAALVEYGLIVAGVALICAASVAVFGHKANDLIAAMAVVLPGAHADDNNPIRSGKIIETTNTGGAIAVDKAKIATTANNTNRLDTNVTGSGTQFGTTLIVENP